MPTLRELQTALRNADAAGDVDAAKIIAAELNKRVGIVPREPATSDMSGLDKFRAGFGKAIVDLGRGVGQLLGQVSQEDIDYSRSLDRDLMQTGAGTAGNISGSVAATLPAAFVPGANTIAGGAAIGALQGALQPVGTDDSRLGNIAMGGAAGALVPAAVKTGKVAKAALIDPFTDKGKQRILAGALRRAATNPEQAAQNLASRTGRTPGFTPTVGQAADDQGLAALERTVRATEPGAFGDVDTSQQAALVNALRGVAGTPEQRVAALSAREAATAPLYEAASGATIPADALEALMKRPSMQAASRAATDLAAERGGTFGTTLADGTPAYTGQALHDLKMGLDTAIMDPQQGFMGAKKAAADATRAEYLNLLESRIPEYGQARQTFAEMSKPINQQDIGKALYERFVPALADNASVPFKVRADSLAQALRSGDDLASSITGMKNAKLSNIMTPDQMSTLEGVVSDAQMRAAQQAAGRGAGSDTVQKMAMSHLVAEAGLPNWMASVGRVPGGMLRTVGDIAFSKNDETLRGLLAEALRDPKTAQELLKKTGLSQSAYAELLRAGAQAPALAIPAIVQGQQ